MDKTIKPIGSQWQISADNSDHEFEIGEKVTIVGHGKELWYSYYNVTNGKKERAVDDYELRPLPPPVAEERTEVSQFLHDIANDFDCDQDPHKYGTMCRSCQARKLISQFNITIPE